MIIVKPPSLPMAIFWVMAAAAPFVVTAVALMTLPPGTTEIPMHIGFDGSVDMGSPSDLWLVAGGLAFCNIIFALSYGANDFLYDHGLVHGVSRQEALKLYVACAIVLVVVQIAVTALLLSMN